MVDQTIENEEELNAEELSVEADGQTEEITSNDDELKEAREAKAEEKPKEEDFKEKYYYLAAEMDNMKRRFAKEKDNLIKFGNEKVLSGLIDVVDNLDRTLDALNGDEDEKVKNIVTGVDMVRTQFLDVLKNNGLKLLETTGEIFDPNFHEALSQQAVEGKKDQEIIQEFQKGYMLNGRLLRAAKVVIAKND
jgi:molecular chaperone GrpE